MKTLVRLLIPAAILAVTSTSQTPVPPRFAVEIPGSKPFPPAYITVRTGARSSSLFYDRSLRRLAGTDPDRRQPTALKLEYEVEGQLVRIHASVFFGDFDRQTTPVSLYNLPSERVGTYSAGLEQSVTLSGLRQFGLEPLTLKIVAAQPPDLVHPQTMSKARSLRVEVTGQTRTVYNVTVHNQSAKGVTAFTLEMRDKNGATDLSARGGSRVVIAPGGTSQHFFPHSVTNANGSQAQNPAPPLLVLAAAFFTDGSYEGEMEAAAEIAADRIGSITQRQRVDPLIAAILADAQSDHSAKLRRVQSALAQLTVEPDGHMVEKLRSQFPGLSDETMNNKMNFAFRSGLRNTKESLASSLSQFEANKHANPTGNSLATWWSTQQEP